MLLGPVELGALLFRGDGVWTESTERGVEACELVVDLAGVMGGSTSSSSGRFWGTGATGAGSSIFGDECCDFELGFSMNCIPLNEL